MTGRIGAVFPSFDPTRTLGNCCNFRRLRQLPVFFLFTKRVNVVCFFLLLFCRHYLKLVLLSASRAKYDAPDDDGCVKLMCIFLPNVFFSEMYCTTVFAPNRDPCDRLLSHIEHDSTSSLADRSV